ncbi:MAG: hypothetical protein IJ240_01220, partial [Clostridia bacterium]|nr:hypothetical protein [Clostridia bacterium]
FRVIKLMETIRDTLPGVLVSASCDLTKLHELTLRGTADEVLERLYANDKAEKGEYCIVLDLRGVSKETQAAPPAELSPELRLLQLLLTREASDLRDAREKLISAGTRKNEAYAASLKVKEFLEAYQVNQ